MKPYKYNKETLTFEETYQLVISRIISSVLILLLLIVSFNTSSKISDLERQIEEKDSIINKKQLRIEAIKAPIRDECYIEDLYTKIGFKLNHEQYKEFSRLAMKYRSKIEAAHVPATLVWWVAFKESRFNKEAKNSLSTAKGMFQFLDGTWNFCCKMNGETNRNRFKEEKQVRIMLVYLNYLHHKYDSWNKSMIEYHGGQYQYPVNFLFR